MGGGRDAPAPAASQPEAAHADLFRALVYRDLNLLAETLALPGAVGAAFAWAGARWELAAALGIDRIRCRRSCFAGTLAARSTDGGASWPAPGALAATSGTAGPMALAADRSGRVFAARSDSPDDLRPTPYGVAWSQPRLYLPALMR